MRINGVKTAIKGHTLFERSGCTINRDLSDAELFFISCCSKMLENNLALKQKTKLHSKSYLKYISRQLTAAALCINSTTLWFFIYFSVIIL